MRASGHLGEEPYAGKPHVRICEGKSRMAALLDRNLWVQRISKSISDPRFRQNVLGLRWIILDFLAKHVHVRPEVFELITVFQTPYGTQNFECIRVVPGCFIINAKSSNAFGDRCISSAPRHTSLRSRSILKAPAPSTVSSAVSWA
jgi:hypothetical protein